MRRRRRVPPCNLPWLAPHALTRADRYLKGWRCAFHTPARLAGRPEPPPGPGWPASAWTTLSPLGASRVHDARAIASGKRRSTPQSYHAAQAAVRKED